MSQAHDGHDLEGGCTCNRVRYRLRGDPLYVHCCHCRWCQRETGSAFAINALIETDRVLLMNNPPELVSTPSESGNGQAVARCPECRIAVWSHYSGLGDAVSFIRVGTLDDPDRLPPDIHIFTASRQPWVVIPTGVPIVDEYYDRRKYWPAESLERLRRLQAG
ncbi:MAG TPA: GFA family protein [Arenicellales bacterium]|nr:GFA family protein [Arenicellales bacterium]